MNEAIMRETIAFFLKDEALRAVAFLVGGGVRARLLCRDVVPGGAGGAMTNPDFVRSVNLISTRGDRLCPPNCYWQPQKGSVNPKKIIWPLKVNIKTVFKLSWFPFDQN